MGDPEKPKDFRQDAYDRLDAKIFADRKNSKLFNKITRPYVLTPLVTLSMVGAYAYMAYVANDVDTKLQPERDALKKNAHQKYIQTNVCL